MLAAGRPEQAAAVLREASALWRGPPLADLAFEPFAQTEIARLEEQQLAALETRVEADAAAGRHAELVPELRRLVAEHPTRERLAAALMLALYRCGRQAEALDAYRGARRTLADEIGIEPGPELRGLQGAILHQDPSLAPPPIGRETRLARFVGRGAELKTLLAGLQAAIAGRGSLMLVSGEPGIGKSRLADELLREASSRGAHVLTGRCWEAGGAPAYWPWVQSLRAFVRSVPPELLQVQLGAGAVEVAQILPELREFFPGLPEPPSRDSDAAQFRLFDATVEFLRNASARQPIVLFLDDLHAADAPSLVLLRFLARELGCTRVLVLGAFRDVDPEPADDPLLDAMVRPALLSMLEERETRARGGPPRWCAPGTRRKLESLTRPQQRADVDASSAVRTGDRGTRGHCRQRIYIALIALCRHFRSARQELNVRPPAKNRVVAGCKATPGAKWEPRRGQDVAPPFGPRDSAPAWR